ncbi:Inner membrane protein yfeZ [Plesiomonas shigelloides]|uniref:DUF2919 domain-containing protein n=1 Tax=Plesiomonas shigelloides TaxID=703 RepID=UPI0007ED5397|nr:DUF2919 domain-containing protein [Plesiomonas shigelloides]AVQ87129.1 DUF2919 domain-containing protein [Plesiomonas shigelloides]KAB7701186.1 DUF2919 family protein [Plesiomonas shigelloides]SBT60261.1 Inner membrane protein yfeZ [Plesiomonas shigelloides]
MSKTADPCLYAPDDYDQHGWLRLPLWYWTILVLQAKTWALFLIAGASRDTGDRLLRLFYPQTDDFWLGMIIGLPAVALFLLAGRRQHWPRLWRSSRRLLPVMLVGDLLLSLKTLLLAPADFSLTAATFSVLTLWALLYVLRSRRLACCFILPAHTSSSSASN